jgi:hypothetical protein
MHLWKREKCPVEDKVLTANPFLGSEGEEGGVDADGGRSFGRRSNGARTPSSGARTSRRQWQPGGRAARNGPRARTTRCVVAGPSGGGSNGARGRRVVPRGPRGGRGSRAAGLRGTGTREDDDVRGGRSFGQRQQWREDVGAARKLGATSI